MNAPEPHDLAWSEHTRRAISRDGQAAPDFKRDATPGHVPDKGMAVLVKSADDKQRDIAALTAPLARPDLLASTRKKI